MPLSLSLAELKLTPTLIQNQRLLQKKKGPFDKSEAEERIEKLSFGYEKAAILKDQHVHPNRTESAEVAPDRASIINAKKFFTDNEDHIKKSDVVEAKAVESTKSGVYTWG